MGKVRAKLAGVCMITALMVGGFAASPVGATTQGPAAVHLPGVYLVHVQWEIAGKHTFTLQLFKNGTGDDGFGDGITWTTPGGTSIQITLVVPNGPTATYSGTVTKKGIDSKASPGGMSNNTGDAGIFWALREHKV